MICTRIGTTPGISIQIVVGVVQPSLRSPRGAAEACRPKCKELAVQMIAPRSGEVATARSPWHIPV